MWLDICIGVGAMMWLSSSLITDSGLLTLKAAPCGSDPIPLSSQLAAWEARNPAISDRDYDKINSCTGGGKQSCFQRREYRNLCLFGDPSVKEFDPVPRQVAGPGRNGLSSSIQSVLSQSRLLHLGRWGSGWIILGRLIQSSQLLANFK